MYADTMLRIRLLFVVGLAILQVPAIAHSAVANSVPTQACKTSQVVLLSSGWWGAGGTGGMAFDIVNLGARCRIGGYPTVSFLNSSAIAVDGRNIHKSSMLFAEPTATTVTLKSGGVATFGVAWADNPAGSETCPSTARAIVVLRQGVGNLWGEVPINSEPCGRALWVTPIESGSWPRPNA